MRSNGGAVEHVTYHDRTLAIFAGAGIVAGSDPDAEVAEIELKLSAALDVLREPDR